MCKGSAKEWSLGGVKRAPAAEGGQNAENTQPRDHSSADPCTCTIHNKTFTKPVSSSSKLSLDPLIIFQPKPINLGVSPPHTLRYATQSSGLRAIMVHQRSQFYAGIPNH